MLVVQVKSVRQTAKECLLSRTLETSSKQMFEGLQVSRVDCSAIKVNGAELFSDACIFL